MSLFIQDNKKLSDAEYIVKYCLIYLNMKKVKDEAIEKIKTHDDNQ